MSQAMRITEIAERSPRMIAQLVDVWEASVRATHLFLSHERIEEIKAYVPHALAEVEHLVIVAAENKTEAESTTADNTETESATEDRSETKAGAAAESNAAAVTGAPPKSGNILGFMGIQDRRLEMLFLTPSARGKGIGRQLLELGIRDYSVRELTVNEQNPQAVGFYQHLGFQTYQRTDHDEQGAPYPLLYMRLTTPA